MWYAFSMNALTIIMSSFLFIGSVGGLTYFLTAQTRRDADKWLVDRRITQRRHDLQDASPSASDKRHNNDRRQSEQQTT